ncbi:hypothetical protein DICVIV_11710 [Dictyocaulus viviparus]|uniref:Uncharacterized protein n=1 Tax=Dictyocaulus viviparus TaxID=29172 RepID=A0A0D8XCJ2_DICVI|nr:hypothetical protein DICVIV_11710 [Dictyocaulus viviparus]
MSSAEEQTPASVVAHAITDIAMTGSQRFRDLCFQLSGVRSQTEFACFLERALSGFFYQEDNSTLLVNVSNFMDMNHNWLFNPQLLYSQSVEDRSDFDSSRLQLNNGDFSSAEDEINAPITPTTIEQDMYQAHFPYNDYFSDDELYDNIRVASNARKSPMKSKLGNKRKLTSIHTFADNSMISIDRMIYHKLVVCVVISILRFVENLFYSLFLFVLCRK